MDPAGSIWKPGGWDRGDEPREEPEEAVPLVSLRRWTPGDESTTLPLVRVRLVRIRMALAHGVGRLERL